MTLRSMTMTARVDGDGVLRIELPGNIANTDVEVVVVVSVGQTNGFKTDSAPTDESLAELSMRAEAHGWPPGFIEQTFGSIPDFPEINRYEAFDQWHRQGEDITRAFNEIADPEQQKSS